MVTIKSIEDEKLKQFEEFISIPMIIFNDREIFYLNGGCKKMLGYEEKDLQKDKILDISDYIEKENIFQDIYHILENDIDPIKQEIFMFKKNKEKIWVEYTGKVVMYNSQKSILAYLSDITDKKMIQSNLSRISRLKALMLEVTQSILKTEDINQLLQLILKNALKALENGLVGTILIKDGDYFTVASHVGFSEDIKDFHLPIEDAFLYKATNGKMDKIVNVPDLMFFDKYYPIKTTFEEKKFIKSTIAAPIYAKGSLFGMINIDSVETNSFDKDDVKSMEFIRNNIEIAISNYLLFKEKSFFAGHDRLTNLYNRYYLEEQFEMIK